MNSSEIVFSITLDLLRYVRDNKPTEENLLNWLGPANSGRFHMLRKAGLLVDLAGTVVLSSAYLSKDGKRFWVHNCCYHIDEDLIEITRYEAG